MTTNFQGNFSATAIGSFPHTNAEVACEIMFKSLPEIPCWPQLPKISTKEEMCIQYTEGLPCIKIHEDGKTVSIDDTQDTSVELERFYELFLKNDPDLFAISPECAAGFYTMLNKLKNQPSKSNRAVKGHVIGPITITLAGSLKLSSGITALYSEEFFIVYQKHFRTAIDKNIVQVLLKISFDSCIYISARLSCHQETIYFEIFYLFEFVWN